MALCVLGGTFLAVAAVYVVVVLGGGAIIGHTRSPHLGLSVLATTIVAVGFEPVRVRLDGWVAERVHQGRLSPYDVLARFSESLVETPVGTEPPDLPAQMARLLVEGTNAKWAQVWVMVADEPELAAAWPAAMEVPAPRGGPAAPGLRTLDVMLGDARLGMLRLQEHPEAPLTHVEEHLFEGLAAQAGLVLRRVQLRAELSHRARDLAALADELLASRQRVVDSHDTERRHLERDIHDGAQQHLVALVVNLRLAHTLEQRSSERAEVVLTDQSVAVDNAITSLVELSRGIYPTILATQGVAAAIRVMVSTAVTRVSVLDRGIGRRGPRGGAGV